MIMRHNEGKLRKKVENKNAIINCFEMFFVVFNTILYRSSPICSFIALQFKIDKNPIIPLKKEGRNFLYNNYHRSLFNAFAEKMRISNSFSVSFLILVFFFDCYPFPFFLSRWNNW